MPTILILGAASDMAMAIAEQFAAKGYDIQLAARNPERLMPLQSDLAIKYNVRASAHEFDALDFDGHSHFVDSLTPQPEITVCVFGYLGNHAVALQNWAEAQRIIHTNYVGAVSILNVVAQRYAGLRAGVIVGISSVAGERGRQSNYIYGSAKAGFTAYLSGLRNRLSSSGVHVLTVQPGFVYTRMTEHLKLPPLLTARPEQVARAVYGAVVRKKNIVYVKWPWRWIMLIIRSIPEFLFKRMKL